MPRPFPRWHPHPWLCVAHPIPECLLLLASELQAQTAAVSYWVAPKPSLLKQTSLFPFRLVPSTGPFMGWCPPAIPSLKPESHPSLISSPSLLHNRNCIYHINSWGVHCVHPQEYCQHRTAKREGNTQPSAPATLIAHPTFAHSSPLPIRSAPLLLVVGNMQQLCQGFKQLWKPGL